MIVVTAPTGQIGRQVLDNLLAGGAPVRVITRDPSRLAASTRERVQVVPGSHGDLDVVTEAFTGADAVFWLVPPDPRADSVEAAYVDFSRPACKALEQQRVARVVGVSALGRGTALAGDTGNVSRRRRRAARRRIVERGGRGPGARSGGLVLQRHG